MALPETWSEVCWVDISRSGAAAVNISPIVETIDIDEGDADVEFIPTVRGGRLAKKLPKAETTITFEGYPVGVSGVYGLDQVFLNDVSDVSEPMSVTLLGPFATNSTYRPMFRVTILWTDDVTADEALGATAAASNSYRYSAINCYLVSYKKSFTDGVLKGTWVFKCGAFTKGGTGCITADHGIATPLVALTTYTASQS